ncbi:hypothetical protein BC938DRAFT_480025 [Jimgerdemannia flammicorona]|uniref:Uncharacterized protein n=1 Tax=Jimgerdemannia flammicorona TaxID=994334 RepID=A0A433QJJ9_9FUNG|nr:hypothetical protein BC938DRAFT_480025 [Jimgerdemannia flammicorona]
MVEPRAANGRMAPIGKCIWTIRIWRTRNLGTDPRDRGEVKRHRLYVFVGDADGKGEIKIYAIVGFICEPFAFPSLMSFVHHFTLVHTCELQGDTDWDLKTQRLHTVQYLHQNKLTLRVHPHPPTVHLYYPTRMSPQTLIKPRPIVPATPAHHYPSAARSRPEVRSDPRPSTDCGSTGPMMPLLPFQSPALPPAYPYPPANPRALHLQNPPPHTFPYPSPSLQRRSPYPSPSPLPTLPSSALPTTSAHA